MNNKKSITEIMFANVLLCLLVVFIHVSSHPVSNLQKDSLSYILVMFPWRLSAFVVQGFIFLASLKIFIKKEIVDYKKYYLSRIKTILIPYITWVFIYYIYFCKIGYFPFNINELVKYIFIGNLVSPFYFIVIIVQFYALMPLWQKLYRKTSPAISICFSLAITLVFKEFFVEILYVLSGYTFKYSDRIFFTYLIFWTLGAVCGLNYNKFTLLLKKNIFSSFIIFSLFAVADLFYSYRAFVFAENIKFLETLHLFYSISAIIIVMTIGLFIKENRVLKKINSVTFSVYLSHCFVMFIVNDKIAQAGIISISKSYAIRFVSVYTITISMCLIYKRLKNCLPSKITVLK